MFPEELKFDDLANPGPGPSPELWSRIAQAHLARRARRRRLRTAGAAACLLVGTLVALVLPRTPAGTDWQARAQALELELRAYPARSVDADDPAALEAAARLMQVDGALQAAYDRGAQKSELAPLWKQRSELLSTLLAVRQQTAAVTRI